LIKQSKIKFSLFVIILAILVIAITSKLLRSNQVVDEQEPITTDTIQKIEMRVEKPFKDSVKHYIKKVNIKYPDIVYAQAVLESMHFTSDLFQANANMFGMKAAKQRPYTYKGVKRGYADYGGDWRLSVLDYALYQSAYMRKLSREEYFQYLGRNYAEDPNYVAKLKSIIKREYQI